MSNTAIEFEGAAVGRLREAYEHPAHAGHHKCVSRLSGWRMGYKNTLQAAGVSFGIEFEEAWRRAVACVPPPVEKWCARCERGLPMAAFFLRSGKSGVKSWCRKCNTADGVARKRARPDYREKDSVGRLHRQWSKKYGMSVADIATMRDRQGGGCGICGATVSASDRKSGRPRYLSVDHDHATNLVRGLLCDRCNRGIGLFGDSIELLLSAVAYLQRAAAAIANNPKAA